MNWEHFKSKFHRSWHKEIRKFIESNECNKIYTTLKASKNEIAPRSTLTFRAFEQPLKDIKCVVLFDEPYSNKFNNIQYADGIPLSCEYVDKLHPELDEFYNAMEREFYGLNLQMRKEKNLHYLRSQGVMFLSSSLTTEINSPERHKKLWVSFIGYVIKNILIKKNIPIVFCGRHLYEQYKKVVPPIYPYFVVEESIMGKSSTNPWNTKDVFTRLNKYLYEDTDHYDIQWVPMDVPF